MWRWLRDRRFSGCKFCRQHPLGDDYLDFFCEEAELNVELDGRQHGFPDQRQHDAERESFLQSHGITPVCVDLIKLERKGIPGRNSDGEALESLIIRASTSPQARQIIRQTVLKEPLYAAAPRAWEADHAKRKS